MINTKRGFTLIELLVVVAIISLLSSVVLASLNSARTKAREARRLSDLHQLDNALTLYVTDNGSYPGSSGTYYWIDDDQLGLAPYLPNVPGVKDPQGYHYAYVVFPGNAGYKLGAVFELSANQGTAFTTNAGTAVTGWYERK